MKTENQKTNNRERPERAYLKYSGLAFQIAITIFLFARLGLYFDRRSGNSKPVYTLILACFGLVGSMIYLIRKVSRP